MATVLVVDDNRNLRMLYEQELGDEGYRIVLAENGQEAMAKLDTHAPDAAVIEVWGKGLGELSLLRRLQKYRSHTSIIANTTRADANGRIASLVDAYLIKSSNLNLLRMEIRKLLQRCKRHQGRHADEPGRPQ